MEPGIWHTDHMLGVYCFFHPLASAYAIGYILGFIVLMQGFNLISLGSNLE